MNAHFRKPVCLDRSYWTVLSPGDDPVTTADRDEAAHILASLFTLIGVKVVEFNPVEGWSRDVTADFDDEDDEFEVAGEHPDSLRRWHEGRVL